MEVNGRSFELHTSSRHYHILLKEWGVKIEIAHIVMVVEQKNLQQKLWFINHITSFFILWLKSYKNADTLDKECDKLTEYIYEKSEVC